MILRICVLVLVFFVCGCPALLLGSNIRIRAICSAEVMDNTEVDFIGKMILDEVMELFATVLPPAETKETMKGFISSSKDLLQIEGTLHTSSKHCLHHCSEKKICCADAFCV